jgi:hypothetical protein
MRIGYNPHKDQPKENSEFTHQVVIPVYIPNEEGYFADSFTNFRLSLASLFATSHDKTFFTVVNNGSCEKIRIYLDGLLYDKKIHELIHTDNIGKVNAIIKGIAGHDIELLTITDADVLFLSHWQYETNKVFQAFPKAGVVGIVPQYKTFTYKCDNLLFDKLFSKSLKFVPVTDPSAMGNFYDSIGWGKTNPDYTKTTLGITQNNLTAYVGSGHFVATYKRDMFDETQNFFGYKLGGGSERYIDGLASRKDYWRLTTYENYAFHMGNVHEAWMDEVVFVKDDFGLFKNNFPAYGNLNGFSFFVKNKVFRKLFANKRVRKLFYRFKKLPKEMRAKY